MICGWKFVYLYYARVTSAGHQGYPFVFAHMIYFVTNIVKLNCNNLQVRNDAFYIISIHWIKSIISNFLDIRIEKNISTLNVKLYYLQVFTRYATENLKLSVFQSDN